MNPTALNVFSHLKYTDMKEHNVSLRIRINKKELKGIMQCFSAYRNLHKDGVCLPITIASSKPLNKCHPPELFPAKAPQRIMCFGSQTAMKSAWRSEGHERFASGVIMRGCARIQITNQVYSMSHSHCKSSHLSDTCQENSEVNLTQAVEHSLRFWAGERSRCETAYKLLMN